MSPSLFLGTLVLSLYSNQLSAKEGWSGRTWQSNLNFKNARNWNIGRIPCDTDRVILQDSKSIVLKIPKGKISFRELVLPSYAEILLPKNGSIYFTEKKDSDTCKGQDAIFKPTRDFLWLDPNNWDRWTQATPDLERVPCASEAVRFPAGATYRVIMPDSVRLGSLEVNGMSMGTIDWFEFVSLDVGIRQFYKVNGDPPIVHVSGQPCDPSQWCECQNEYLRSQICTAACPLPLCKEPIKPSGFCCPICGVYFLLESKSGDNRRLSDHIDSFLRGKGVVWHASKVGELVQVVLVEQDEYSGEVPDIAEDLKTSIEKSSLGWTVRKFYASGHVWYPTTFGHVLGHFLSLMVFAGLALAAIIVFYSKNWTWTSFSPLEGRPFVFARFENQSAEVVLQNEPREHPLTQPKAFDNPMYGATEQEERNVTLENKEAVEETSKSGEIEEGIALDITNFAEEQ